MRPRLSTWLRFVVQLPALVAIGCVRLYQFVLSPLLGGRCRFHPSCSHYSVDCFRKYGFLRGGIKTIARLSRCHPWHPGGYDPA